MAAFGNYVYGTDTATWNANAVYGAANTALPGFYYFQPVPKFVEPSWPSSSTPRPKPPPPPVTVPPVKEPRAQFVFAPALVRKTPMARGPSGWVRRPAGRPLRGLR